MAQRLRNCLLSMRCRFDPWVRNIPWGRERRLTPVFLPGKSQGQRSLVGYSPWGHKELDMTSVQFSSIESLCDPVSLCCTLGAAHQAPLSITSSQSLLKLTSIESVMPSAISSSVVPFSSCPQYLPASGSFPMSQFFISCGQSIGASASVLPMNIQD